MRPNKLRTLLKEGKPSFSTHVHSTWPSVIEAVGHTGVYDYVEFVAEYGPYTLHDLDNLCRAAELYDLGMMIKVDHDTHQFVAQRAVGSGFQSVLFADCHDVDEVRDCIRAVKPDTLTDGGRFGVGTRRHAYMGYGGGPDYVEALRDTVVMLMVEKKGAVDQLEEILALPGLDMVQWGGSDYSMNVGKAGQRNSDEIRAVEKYVIETSLKMGVQPRAEIGSPADAEYYLDLGVRHFSIGTDLSILYQWFKSNGTALRKLVEGESK
ncbi:MAG: aldolase/citrate lyase family protein [Caldilineaceae bacterium]